MELKGKVILITGASSGIGAATALVMASKGAKTALLARREEKLMEVAKKVFESGSEALVLLADITQKPQVDEAVKRCAEHFGRLDVIVNSAGIGYFGPIEKMSDDDFNKIIQINVFGILHTVQASLPYLKKTKGMVVNISSFLGQRALPFLTALAGTKSMVNALSEGMRVELKRYDIKVLNYGPPETDSEFFASTIHDPSMEQKESKRKKANPIDVAKRITQAVISEKRDVVEGRFFRIMNFFAPRLLDNMFYKSMVLKLTPLEEENLLRDSR